MREKIDRRGKKIGIQEITYRVLYHCVTAYPRELPSLQPLDCRDSYPGGIGGPAEGGGDGEL